MTSKATKPPEKKTGVIGAKIAKRPTGKSAKPTSKPAKQLASLAPGGSDARELILAFYGAPDVKEKYEGGDKAGLLDDGSRVNTHVRIDRVRQLATIFKDLSPLQQENAVEVFDDEVSNYDLPAPFTEEINSFLRGSGELTSKYWDASGKECPRYGDSYVEDMQQDHAPGFMQNICDNEEVLALLTAMLKDPTDAQHAQSLASRINGPIQEEGTKANDKRVLTLDFDTICREYISLCQKQHSALQFAKGSAERQKQEREIEEGRKLLERKLDEKHYPSSWMKCFDRCAAQKLEECQQNNSAPFPQVDQTQALRRFAEIKTDSKGDESVPSQLPGASQPPPGPATPGAQSTEQSLAFQPLQTEGVKGFPKSNASIYGLTVCIKAQGSAKYAIVNVATENKPVYRVVLATQIFGKLTDERLANLPGGIQVKKPQMLDARGPEHFKDALAMVETDPTSLTGRGPVTWFLVNWDNSNAVFSDEECPDQEWISRSQLEKVIGSPFVNALRNGTVPTSLKSRRDESLAIAEACRRLKIDPDTKQALTELDRATRPWLFEEFSIYGTQPRKPRLQKAGLKQDSSPVNGNGKSVIDSVLTSDAVNASNQAPAPPAQQDKSSTVPTQSITEAFSERLNGLESTMAAIMSHLQSLTKAPLTTE